MSRLVCTDTSCERAGVRNRDGQWWCMFHPDSDPPVVDPKTGKPISATPIRVKRPKNEKPSTYRAPGRVVIPAGGPCATEGCVRPARHRGVHSYPKPAKAPRPEPQPRKTATILGGPCREGYTDIRIRLDPGLYDAIQQHLPSTGHQYVTHYIRELILADVNAARLEQEQVA